MHRSRAVVVLFLLLLKLMVIQADGGTPRRTTNDPAVDQTPS